MEENNLTERSRRTRRSTTKYPVVTTSTSGSGDVDLRLNGATKRKTYDIKDSEDDELQIIETKTSRTKKPAPKFSNLAFLLTDSRSPLCNVELTDLINGNTWALLTPEVQANLCKLLPRTAFNDFPEEVDEWHPAKKDTHRTQSDVTMSEPRNHNSSCRDTNTERSLSDVIKGFLQLETNASGERRKEENSDANLNGDTVSNELVERLDPSFFTDAHFLSALRTFQDQLYTGWYTQTHRRLVEKHIESVRSGTAHAPWKDDVWAQDHPEVETEEEVGDDDDDDEAMTSSPTFQLGVRKGKSRVKKSRSQNTELTDLVGCGGIKVGDVLAFRKHLATLGFTLEKDALVHSINPKTNALTLLSTTGPDPSLPNHLLVQNAQIDNNHSESISIPGVGTIINDLPEHHNSEPTTQNIRTLTLLTPGQLESALAELDGRIARGARTGGNAWKCITVWRWPPGWPACVGMEREDAELVTLAGALVRGGRECYGTLNYLRASLDE